MELSIIIPAFNEEARIGSTVEAVLRARESIAFSNGRPFSARDVEIIVVDNGSEDRTAEIVDTLTADVRVERRTTRGAARARNYGARSARGRVLVFIDADTEMPPHALDRVLEHTKLAGYEAGICRLAELEGGRRARLWWWFWEHVRRLPLARAKAMPAFMFCTRDVFDEMGGFDERVAIGEEWPILAELYRRRPGRLIYDRGLTALSSSRRMEKQSWGYLRTLLKYGWAILHISGRVHYTTRIR